MNGDKLELKDRIVYVNGEPFGKVPKICEVKFIVSGADRKLYVDGKFRADVPAGTRR